MFILEEQSEFTWPVKLKKVSKSQPGKFENVELALKFKELDSEEMVKALDSDSKAFCKKVIVGWENVQTEQGQKIEFSEQNLNRILKKYTWATEIMVQYTHMMRTKEFEEKN